MNKKLIVFLFFSLVTLPIISHSSAPINYFCEKKITEQQLKDLAVEKLFIPYNADKAYFKDELEQKHSIPIWIIAQRSQKIEMIDAVKKCF